MSLRALLPPIDRPIFIVGSARSGTTVFYELFARHPDVAFQHEALTGRIPVSCPDPAHSPYTYFFQPSEGREVWTVLLAPPHPFPDENDAKTELGAFIWGAVYQCLVSQRKNRFVNKCPDNSAALRFLNAVFPDACFIHVLRDGRDVAYSLRRQKLETGHPLWGGRPRDWERLMALPPLEASAGQWASFVREVAGCRALLGDRFMEVRYEDLVSDPRAVLRRAWKHCGLERTPNLISKIPRKLENRNGQYKGALSAGERRRVEAQVEDLLRELDYL